MAFTRIGAEQAKLKSSRTGDHVIDDYLEACEIGDRTLYDLLGDVFDLTGSVRPDLFEFRDDPLNPGIPQVRVGVFTDPDAGWQPMPPVFASETFFSGTSATSNSVGIGSKTFITQEERAFEPGKWVLITYTLDPTIYMHGEVISYAVDTLNVQVTNISAVLGTYADWQISISGTQGAKGDPGVDAFQNLDGGDAVGGIPGTADGYDANGDPSGPPVLAGNNGSDFYSAAAVRANLGIGTLGVQNSNSASITGGSITGITDLAIADGGTGSSTASGARSNLGLVIGTNVQAQDATLQSLSFLGTAADKLAYTTALDTWAETGITAVARTLLNAATSAAQRSTLGLAIGTDVQAQSDLLSNISLNVATSGTIEKTGATTIGTYTVTAAAKSVLDDVSAAAMRTTLGVDTTTNISDVLNKRYVTDANLVVIGNTSNTNTGDQTSVTGNAGSATVLQTARTIDGVSFNGSANITTLAEATHAATNKATPVDADELPLSDSAASFVLKHLTWANIKATLKTYFDTLYNPIPTTYNPADQTITAAGALTLPHSLGAAPLTIKSFLVCQTAENGYTAGDVVQVTGTFSQGNNQGVAYTPDATNLNARFGSAAATFSVLNKTTGAATSITNANWKLRIYAKVSL